MDLMNMQILFVILTNIVIKVYSKRSVAFVIDDTGSMHNEIYQVKIQTNEVFDAIYESDKSKFDNFVLVSFNDPDSEVRVITQNPDEFKKSLDSLSVDGGGDCPEMAMAGILNALNVCPSNSVIYVFTDASAKDHHRFEEVKSLSQKKSIQVTFLLTGVCDGKVTGDDYLVYHKIAAATSGLVFHMKKDDIHEVIKYIIESISSEKNLLAREGSSNCPINTTFYVDSDTRSVMISASKIWDYKNEDNPEMQLTVVDSTGNTVKAYYILDTTYIKILKLSNPKPGYYTANLKCFDNNLSTVLAVVGTMTVSFQHGFSQDKPTSINDTSTLPLPGKKSYLSIELDNPEKDVKLVTVELIDVAGKVIQAMDLKLIDAEQQLYTTIDNFVPPNEMFKIKINGYTESKENITRVGATYIEPEKMFGEVILTPPVIITESNKSITLSCVVQAYPKPDVSWENDKGEKFEPKAISVDAKGSYESVLQIEKVNTNATYYCKAENSVGKAEAYSNVYVIKRPVIKYEPPVINNWKPRISSVLNDIIQIPCTVIKGKPSPVIEWFKNRKKITDDKKYTIFTNNTLRFKADFSDNDDFFCKASNVVGYHEKNVAITVLWKPVIESEERTINIAENKELDLPCTAKGNPQPQLRWVKNSKVLGGVGSKFKVFSDHTLRFTTDVTDSGYYFCIAKNKLGEDKKAYYLNVHVPVRVNVPEQTKITILVGGTLELPCSASGHPEPIVKMTFIPYDLELPPKVLLQGTTPGEKVILKENYAREERSGYYLCSASNEYSSSNFTYTVEIEAPPYIEKEPTNDYNAVEGDIVLRVPCKAHGNPKPMITWMHDGLELATTDTQFIDKDGALVLIKPDSSLDGMYTCEARNILSKVTKIVDVKILPSPILPDNTEDVSQTWIVEGRRSEILCNITHGPLDLVRWYKDGKMIATGELLLENPSLLDKGLYTCRVSNERASESYHTKMTVGFGPLFISPDPTEPIQYVKGSDAFLDCSAQAVPNPKITWTQEDRKIMVNSMDYHITDMDRKHIGVYKCTISNKFGKITREYRIRSEECQLSISEDFLGHQPLMLAEVSKWPQLEIRNRFLIVPEEKPLLLLCPDSSFDYPGLSWEDKLKAVCIKDSLFDVNGQKIKFSDLKCRNEVVPYARPNNIQCLPDRTKASELYTIGYRYESQFFGVYDICYDKEDYIPVFSRHSLHSAITSNEPLKEEPQFVNDIDSPHNFDQLYHPPGQIRSLSYLLGRDFKGDSCHFAKKQLVITNDVIPGLSQIATYNYLNIMPHWSPCYRQNWDEVENRVRSYGLSLKYSVYVWTGTSGRMRLRDQKLDSDDVHLHDDDNNKQYVPLFLWKVIESYEEGSVAIIQINIPDLSIDEAGRYVKCTDICSRLSWLKNEEWHDVTKGYTYCCQIIDFENNFNFKRMFKGPVNVLGM